FFFSSRRRHTRFSRDWSSDVCSSDLIDAPDIDFQATLSEILLDGSSVFLTRDMVRARYRESLREEKLVTPGEINRYEFDSFTFRSEERRVGKEGRSRGSPAA